MSPMRWVMLIRQNDQRSSSPIVDLSEFNNNPDVVVVFAPKVWQAKKDFTPLRGGARRQSTKADGALLSTWSQSCWLGSQVEEWQRDSRYDDPEEVEEVLISYQCSDNDKSELVLWPPVQLVEMATNFMGCYAIRAGR